MNENPSFITKPTEPDIIIRPPEACGPYDCFGEGDLLFIEKGSDEKVGYFSGSPYPLTGYRGCNLVQLNYLLKKEAHAREKGDAENYANSDDAIKFVNKWNFVGIVSQVNRRGESTILKKTSSVNTYTVKVRMNTIVRMKNYVGSLLKDGDEYSLVRIIVKFNAEEPLVYPYDEKITNGTTVLAKTILVPQYVVLTNLKKQLIGDQQIHNPIEIDQPWLIKLGTRCIGTPYSSNFDKVDPPSYDYDDDDNETSEKKTEPISLGKYLETTKYKTTQNRRLLNVILNN